MRYLNVITSLSLPASSFAFTVISIVLFVSFVDSGFAITPELVQIHFPFTLSSATEPEIVCVSVSILTVTVTGVVLSRLLFSETSILRFWPCVRPTVFCCSVESSSQLSPSPTLTLSTTGGWPSILSALAGVTSLTFPASSLALNTRYLVPSVRPFM